jgi:homoserine acetyltransferase
MVRARCSTGWDRNIALRIGDRMGGMQVLQWTAAYPERFSALPVAC